MVKKHTIAKISLTLCLAFISVTALLGLMGILSVAYADGPLYVATTGSDGPVPANTCLNSAKPCRTIQYAVFKAHPNDIIKVAGGVYTDLHRYPAPDGYFPAGGFITQVVFITKSISIRGGYNMAFNEPPDPNKSLTTLSVPKLQKGRLMVIAGTITPTIYGLRLTGGDAAGQGGADWYAGKDSGGGIYIMNATATLHNNWIYHNQADGGYGGGILLWNSPSILNQNSITTNTVTTETVTAEGGGIYMRNSNATLNQNTIVSNTASYGGGLSMMGAAALMGNTFMSNTARYGGGLSLSGLGATLSGNIVAANTAADEGGGLYLNQSNASLSGNTIMSNTAEYGGGVSLSSSSTTLNGNTILANTAFYYGGGLYLADSDGTLSGNAIVSNTADDRGGGIILTSDSHTVLSSTIIMSNTAPLGGGIYLWDSNATLTNTVIADNRASNGGSALRLMGSSANLLHTTIARNSGGEGSGIYVTFNGETPGVITMTNTILVSHTLGITLTTRATATLESTLWYSNTQIWGGAGAIFTGTNNYWGDPRFDTDGYHLLADSAAISRAITANVTTDIDGDPRDATPDLGADEWVSFKVYLPIILKN